MFKQSKILKILFIGIGLAIFSFVIFKITPVWGEDDLLNAEIQQLNNQIQSQKQQLDSLAEKQKAYSQAIEAKQKEKITLSSQLELLETRVAKAESEIESANLEINKTDLEARKISLDIIDTNSRVDSQKEHISKLLRLVYKQDKVSTLEVLLLNDSISEFLNQAKYLENANEELKNSLVELQEDKEKLERAQVNIKDKKDNLVALRKEMEDKKADLDYQRSAKNNLLEETKLSENAYQDLLAQAKKEAQQAEAEISSLEKTVRDKMSQGNKNILSGSDSTISWPVTGHYITASFHDPDYPFRRIIGEHSGIDIRSSQGSPLYAAADGYVARAKFDGSTAYSYIMLIHDNGLSTVYGHISGVNVEVDQYVSKGQIIGSTGGSPGMPGSGPFSTGPHLHFEVRKNGIPVNPLDYLTN